MFIWAFRIQEFPHWAMEPNEKAWHTVSIHVKGFFSLFAFRRYFYVSLVAFKFKQSANEPDKFSIFGQVKYLNTTTGHRWIGYWAPDFKHWGNETALTRYLYSRGMDAKLLGVLVLLICCVRWKLRFSQVAILQSFRNSPMAITSFEKALESSSVTLSRARDGVATPKSGTHQVAI